MKKTAKNVNCFIQDCKIEQLKEHKKTFVTKSFSENITQPFIENLNENNYNNNLTYINNKSDILTNLDNSDDHVFIVMILSTATQ